MKQVTYHTYQKENKIKEAALPQEIRQQIAALDDMIDVFNNMEDDDPELDAYETKLHALSDNIVENVKKHINEDAAAKAAEAEKEAKAKEASEKAEADKKAKAEADNPTPPPPTASAPPQPKPTETKPSENPTPASGSWGDVDDIMGM